MEEGVKANRKVPPQIGKGLAKLTKAIKGGNLYLVDNFIANFILTLIIQIEWNCLDDLSFMLINTMISMPVPGIVQIVQSVLLNFIYLDVLLTDMWMP
jgi:hypothetical protein